MRVSNGSERLDYHGGRRVSIPGIPSVVEIVSPDEVIVTEPLSPKQYEILIQWLEVEWPKVGNGYGGYP